MKSVALNALTAACLAALAGPVFADAYSSATFGNVTMTMIDLNPNDGIAPSITFLRDPNSSGAGPYVDANVTGFAPGYEEASFHHGSSRPGASINETAQVGTTSLTASVTGLDGGAGFTAMSLSASSVSTADSLAHFNGRATVPGPESGRMFTISANTMVTFSAATTLDTSVTIGYPLAVQEGEHAYAWASMVVRGSAVDGSDSYNEASHSVLSQGEYGAPPGMVNDSWSGLLSTSYSNLSAGSVIAGFYADMRVNGYAISTPVPEPESYATLLGGLGLMTLRLRRARRASSTTALS